MGFLITALTGAVIALLWIAGSTHRRTEILSRANGLRAQELARLRARIEALERAQDPKPGTSTHATACHVCGGAATKGISLNNQPICAACQVEQFQKEES